MGLLRAEDVPSWLAATDGEGLLLLIVASPLRQVIKFAHCMPRNQTEEAGNVSIQFNSISFTVN